MELSSLAEVQRWVLSWAGEAKVLRPRELAEAVKTAANRIMQNAG
jgi:predicted DNA-binding transcriptional regulator YafY